MGMMGRLTEHDREMITLAIEGVALNDVGLILKAVLGLGEFKERPEQRKLYEDIEGLLLKYGSTDMGKINVAEVMTDLMEVMKENKIMMPHGLTMLARRTYAYGRCTFQYRTGYQYGGDCQSKTCCGFSSQF